jgi:hypothetical protein
VAVRTNAYRRARQEARKMENIGLQDGKGEISGHGRSYGKGKYEQHGKRISDVNRNQLPRLHQRRGQRAENAGAVAGYDRAREDKKEGQRHENAHKVGENEILHLHVQFYGKGGREDEAQQVLNEMQQVEMGDLEEYYVRNVKLIEAERIGLGRAEEEQDID